MHYKNYDESMFLNSLIQLDETFTVRLSSVSGSILGNNSSFNITILSSDDPHGLVSFKDISENLNQDVRKF